MCIRDRLRAEAELTPLVSARDLYLAGSQHARSGRHRDALKLLERATRLDPENFSAWFLRGNAHLALEQNELAAMCFAACVSLRPEHAPAWMNRGLAFSRLRFHRDAREDYDQAVKLDPKLTEAYFQRAELREATEDLDGAIEDYTRALATGTASARVYFKRATAKFMKKDFEGAKADRAAGFRVVPADEMSWVARAENRLGEDPNGALADADEALKLNPWSVYALQTKAAILSESLKRESDAIAVLEDVYKRQAIHRLSGDRVAGCAIGELMRIVWRVHRNTRSRPHESAATRQTGRVGQPATCANRRTVECVHSRAE